MEHELNNPLSDYQHAIDQYVPSARLNMRRNLYYLIFVSTLNEVSSNHKPMDGTLLYAPAITSVELPYAPRSEHELNAFAGTIIPDQHVQIVHWLIRDDTFLFYRIFHSKQSILNKKSVNLLHD